MRLMKLMAAMLPSIDMSSIDWSRPWYASIAAAARDVVSSHDWLAALNRCAAESTLVNHRGLPLKFVEQAALPSGMAYEAFISSDGTIPTRDNLHDLFNGLVWLSFPEIKRQLNALQAAQIERIGIGKSRGPARDAATIFDENCALLVVSDSDQGRALVAAMRNHHWRTAFIEQRAMFNAHAHSQAQVWLFGHALMEKLVSPYKSITAHTWVVMAPSEYFQMPHPAQRQWLDTFIANDLQQRAAEDFNTKCFTPLPVLGVPGWWSSQDGDFYDDTAVFRPKPVR